MSMNAWIAEYIALMDAVVGIPLTATPLETAFIKMGDQCRKMMGVAHIGVPPDTTTIQVSIYQASASDGTGETSLKDATLRAAHATNNDDKIIIVEVDMDDVEAGDAAKPWVQLRLTAGIANYILAASLMLFGGDIRNRPAADIDDSNILEIKR